MTAAELVAERIAPFWLTPERATGDPIADAATAIGQRHRKADGTTLTQFNTGALVVRPESVLALTECQPVRPHPSVRMAPPTKARAAVIADIARNGPPLLAVLFRKGALDIRAWVCCTEDEVVLNGPAGPEESALLADVAYLRSLPAPLLGWRRAAGLYAQAEAASSLADKLFVEADRLGALAGLPRRTVLDMLHRLRRVQSLAYALAEAGGTGA